MVSNPGQVIQSENLAALWAEAWPKALPPVNIMNGFKKSGLFSLNPGEVLDRGKTGLAPSTVYSSLWLLPPYNQT